MPWLQLELQDASQKEYPCVHTMMISHVQPLVFAGLWAHVKQWFQEVFCRSSTHRYFTAGTTDVIPMASIVDHGCFMAVTACTGSPGQFRLQANTRVREPEVPLAPPACGAGHGGGACILST